jgi:hypothetical protein
LKKDPNEMENLATSVAALDRISTFAEHWWREHPPPEEKQDGPVDDALIERLKALGHID